jgi:hypothetical protein
MSVEQEYRRGRSFRLRQVRPWVDLGFAEALTWA